MEKGKAADLIVLDRNLFDLAPEDLLKARVLMTMVEGKAVFGEEFIEKSARKE